jgi:ribosomal protein L11 methyltransferase
MIELFPEGFEEIESDDGVELAAYTDAGGEERLWHAFGGARTQVVGEGWEERWRDFHSPVRVGRVWIGQPWQEPPADALTVFIDPGRAFGTGAHATTRLCLELLAAAAPGSLLDIGCGSGVLAIAAAKLGFAPVLAVDHDEAAVAAAGANAKANGAGIEVRQADALVDELPATDLAVANITRADAEAVASRVECRTLITSGYLASDELELSRFDHVERVTTEGWAADVHKRRA